MYSIDNLFASFHFVYIRIIPLFPVPIQAICILFLKRKYDELIMNNNTTTTRMITVAMVMTLTMAMTMTTTIETTTTAIPSYWLFTFSATSGRILYLIFSNSLKLILCVLHWSGWTCSCVLSGCLKWLFVRATKTDCNVLAENEMYEDAFAWNQVEHGRNVCPWKVPIFIFSFRNGKNEYRFPCHNHICNAVPFRMKNDSSWITSKTEWNEASHCCSIRIDTPIASLFAYVNGMGSIKDWLPYDEFCESFVRSPTILSLKHLTLTIHRCHRHHHH